MERRKRASSRPWVVAAAGARCCSHAAATTTNVTSWRQSAAGLRPPVAARSASAFKLLGDRALLACLVLVNAAGVLPGGGFVQQAAARPTLEGRIVEMPLASHLAPFSERWAENFQKPEHGCGDGRGSYTWRKFGWGSNVNNMLNAWVYAIAVEGWSDLSLISNPWHFGEVDCSVESGGLVSNGWSCLFEEVPHMCTFENKEEWKSHMTSRGVSDDDMEEATRLTLHAVRFGQDDIAAGLEGMNVDHIGALAVISKHFLSRMTPWLEEDVKSLTSVVGEHAFDDTPYVGIHVRRGDKIRQHEANFIDVKDYLEAAADYLNDDPDRVAVEDIKGIWVASDDPSVVEEVRDLASSYFPSVSKAAIAYISDGVPTGQGEDEKENEVATHTYKQGYRDFVNLFGDLHRLTRGVVFAGTFTSNIGRLVVVLREAEGSFPRDSSISLDDPEWTAG